MGLGFNLSFSFGLRCMGNWNKWPGDNSESLHTNPNLAQHLLNLTQERERETQLKRVQERERKGNSCERCQRCWAKRESQLQSQYSMHSFWQAGDNVLELETLIGLSLPRPRLSFSLSLFPHNQCNLITKAAQAIRHVKQLLHPEMQIQIDKSRFLTVTGLGQVSVSVSDYWSTVKGSSLYIFGFLSSKFAVGVFFFVFFW